MCLDSVFGSSSDTQSSSSTNSVAPNADAMAAYKKALGMADTATSTGYQPYSGELVAGLNGTQNQAFSQIGNLQGYGQNYLDSAASALGSSQTPLMSNVQQFNNANVAQYQNPYLQQTVNATMANMNNQDAQQQQALTGNAISKGAWGGDRAGIASAALAGQQSLAKDSTMAGLESQGYQQALGELNNQQNLQLSGAQSQSLLGLQGASGYQNLANTGTSLGLQQANALYGAGTAQQQNSQQNDNAAYEQWAAQQAYPYQNAQFYANIAEGVGSGMGSTTTGSGTYTTPGASGFSQGLGALTSSVGALGQTGAFTTGQSGTGNYNSGWLFHKGGRIHRDSGGSTPSMPSSPIDFSSYIPSAQSGVGHAATLQGTPYNFPHQGGSGGGSSSGGGAGGLGSLTDIFKTIGLGSGSKSGSTSGGTSSGGIGSLGDIIGNGGSYDAGSGVSFGDQVASNEAASNSSSFMGSPVASDGVDYVSSFFRNGGRTPRKIGGEVLPDIISGIGDVVGAFFGDPMAGDQGVGILSNLDGGRTGGAGVGTQLLGMAQGKSDSQIQNGASGTPGMGLNAAFNPGETNAQGKFAGGIGSQAGNGMGIASMFMRRGGAAHRDMGGLVDAAMMDSGNGALSSSDAGYDLARNVAQRRQALQASNQNGLAAAFPMAQKHAHGGRARFADGGTDGIDYAQLDSFVPPVDLSNDVVYRGARGTVPPPPTPTQIADQTGGIRLDGPAPKERSMDDVLAGLAAAKDSAPSRDVAQLPEPQQAPYGDNVVDFPAGRAAANAVSLPQKGESMGLGATAGDTSGMSPSIDMSKYEKMAERLRDEGNPNPWLALMQAGFGMMAGQSPHALVNIGKGAQEGLSNWQNQKAKQITADEAADKLMEQVDAHRAAEQQAVQLKQYSEDQANKRAADTNDLRRDSNARLSAHDKEMEALMKQRAQNGTDSNAFRAFMAGYGTNPYAQPGEPRVPSEAITPDTHGEQFLASLPESQSDRLRALYTGRENMTAYMKRDKPFMNSLYQAYPDYSEQAAGVMKRVVTGKDADTLQGLNTSIMHINTASKLIDDLNNGDMTDFSKVANVWSKHTGQPAVTNFESVRDVLADELARTIVGGQNAEKDREGFKNSMAAANSPDQLKGVINQYQQLMAGRIEPIMQRYTTQTHNKDFLDKMLLPQAKQAIEPLLSDETRGTMGVSPKSVSPAAPQTGTSTAAPAAPAQGAKQAPDGNWYLPDPDRPGKYLRVN